jgi:hypothetical protein
MLSDKVAKLSVALNKLTHEPTPWHNFYAQLLCFLQGATYQTLSDAAPTQLSWNLGVKDRHRVAAHAVVGNR